MTARPPCLDPNPRHRIKPNGENLWPNFGRSGKYGLRNCSGRLVRIFDYYAAEAEMCRAPLYVASAGGVLLLLRHLTCQFPMAPLDISLTQWNDYLSC